jgi:putative ABC transport system permease protein
MKFADLIGTAIASTFRSKLRTTLTVVAIFIGAFTLSITSAIGTGVSAYINTQVASIGATNVMTVSKTSENDSASNAPRKYSASSASSTEGAVEGSDSSSALTPKDISRLRTIRGIDSVSPSIEVAPDYIQYQPHGKYVLALSTSAGLSKADLAAGAQLNDSSRAHQLLLPFNYVKPLGFSSAKDAVGKPVTIGITNYAGRQTTVTATVIGVQNTSLFGVGAGTNTALTMQLQKTQAVGKPATIKTDYASALVTFKKNSSSAQIQQLKSRLTRDGYTGLTVTDLLGDFKTVINGIVGVLDAFAVIALIAAGFGIINTLLMSVQERTREIGLMKAMGMGGGRIYILFSLEAVFIGFLGSAIGAGAAIAVGSLISAALSRGFLHALPGLHLLQFSVPSVATIVIVVMLIAFVAGTLPARRAARQNPIEALRYE